MIRTEFTGMLPAAIQKFEELLADPAVAALNPTIVQGYDAVPGPDSFFAWGCACTIACNDAGTLRARAEALDITWLGDDGSMAYTAGLTIDDFKSFRVDGSLTLQPVQEEE